MGQLYSDFMDDTYLLLTPTQINEYKMRLEAIHLLKECCKSNNLKFISMNPKNVTFRCAKCTKSIVYDHNFRSYYFT